MKTVNALISTVVVLLMCTSLVHAQSMDFELTAGSSSVAGGIFLKRPLASGYMKYGISGVYSDDDDADYQWGSFQVLVGSDTFSPGLWAEIGLKALYGSAEERIYSGDIGAVAFTGRLGYILPIRFPVELFGGLTYAPGPLAFMDAESFSEINIGIGFRIIQQAGIEISYHAYNIEMEERPGSWEFDDSVVRFGISMRF